MINFATNSTQKSPIKGRKIANDQLQSYQAREINPKIRPRKNNYSLNLNQQQTYQGYLNEYTEIPITSGREQELSWYDNLKSQHIQLNPTQSEIKIRNPQNGQPNKQTIKKKKKKKFHHQTEVNDKQITIADLRTSEQKAPSDLFERNNAIRKSQQIYSTEKRVRLKKKKSSKSKTHKHSLSAERMHQTEIQNNPSASQSEIFYKSPPNRIFKQNINKNSSKKKSTAASSSAKPKVFFNENKEKEPVSFQKRRKELGLDFLNNLQDKQIGKILEKSRIKQVTDVNVITTTERKPLFTPTQLQEIKKYMKHKKRFQQQVDLMTNQKKLIQQKNIIENLRSLEQQIKKKSRSHSKSPQKQNIQQQYEQLVEKFQDLKQKIGSQEQVFEIHQNEHLGPNVSIGASFVNLMSQSSSNNLFSIKSSDQQFYFDAIDTRRYLAATRIQKHWRGYFTRKMLFQYAEMVQAAFNQEEEEKVDDDQQNLSLSNQHIKEDKLLTNPPQSLEQSVLNIEKFQLEEVKKWENMKSLIVTLQSQAKDKKDYDEVFKQLLQYTEMYKGNVLKSSNSQSQQFKSQSSTQKKKLEIDIEQINQSDHFEAKESHKSEKYSDIASPINLTIYSMKQIGQIIKLRFQLIKEREKKEKAMLKEMLVQDRISPRTFSLKEKEIILRGQQEKIQLDQNKNAIKEGWIKAYETIQKTQRDLKFVQKIKGESKKAMGVMNMHISLSQSQMLKTQLFDLKMNLGNYSEEILIAADFNSSKQPQDLSQNTSQSEIRPIMNYVEQIEQQQKKQLTEGSMVCQPSVENQSFNSFIQCLEDAPLEMEHLTNEFNSSDQSKKQNLIQPMIPFKKLQEQQEKSEKQEIQQSHSKQDQKEFSQEVTQVKEDIIELKMPTPLVETHQDSIKNYLEEIVRIIFEMFRQKFMVLINTPIGPTPSEILRFFRFTDEMIMDDTALEAGFQHQAVLGLECFAIRERRKEQAQGNQQNEFISELERIHNKAIFDAFNESLDYFRPFGIKGRPLPWKKCAQHKLRTYAEHDEMKVLKQAQKKVIDWSETLCGILLPSLSLGMGNNNGFDDQLLPQIREERLDKLLKNEILETDERWQEFEEEITEVSLELSEVIFDMLIYEAADDLNKFGKKRGIRVLQKQEISNFDIMSNPYI